MITVKYYGPLRSLTGIPEEEIEAKRIREVIKVIARKYGKEAAKESEKCFIMVNGKNAALLNGFRTPLNSGDVVQIINLTGGG